jgi:hypothetical protein
MGVVKKIKKEDIETAAVLNLVTEKQGYEAAIGNGFYMLYPLPSTVYTKLMSVVRQIWYTMLSDKETEYADAISAARALSQNMGEVDDEDVKDSVMDLMTKLTSSREIHPLEFLTHEKFAAEIEYLITLLTDGCDKEDLEQLTLEQLARLLEICFIQNFLPFIRLANTANRVFRGDSD